MIIKIASTPNVQGVEVISDSQRSYRIRLDKEYILSFTNGSVTMKAFKELFLMNKTIMFYVTNFEFFIYEMRMFKYCDFVFVEHPTNVDERTERYKDVETLLSGKWCDRGVEVSFEPDVFRSIRSSLMRPDLYLSDDNLSTLIYRTLDGKKGYQELKELVRTKRSKLKGTDDFDRVFDDSLKSLLFVGAIKMKDEMLSHSSSLCMSLFEV